MKYFAIINGEQEGPYSVEQLVQADIKPSTYVWCKGMPDWQQAREIADICRAYRNHIHDLKHPQEQVFQEINNPSEFGIKNLEFGKGNSHSNSNFLNPNSNSDDGIPPRFRYYLEKSGEKYEAWPDDPEDFSRQPQTWLWQAILTTIFCCPPTGFVAIFYAAKSTSRWKAGQQREAHECAKTAKIWTLLTFFFGFLVWAFMLKSSL